MVGEACFVEALQGSLNCRHGRNETMQINGNFGGTCASTCIVWVGNMGVSKNMETPQNGWFIMENPIEMDDLGGFPIIFWKHPYNDPCTIFCGCLLQRFEQWNP